MVYKYVFVKRSKVCKAIEKSKSIYICKKPWKWKKIIITHNNAYSMMNSIIIYNLLCVFINKNQWWVSQSWSNA